MKARVVYATCSRDGHFQGMLMIEQADVIDDQCLDTNDDGTYDFKWRDNSGVHEGHYIEKISII